MDVCCVCGSRREERVGTESIRKEFKGVMGMVAIEIGLKYAYGIVLNGMEMLGDKMGEGEVIVERMGSGSYSTGDYRGVIYPASVAQYSQSILGVELHLMDSVSRVIDFNAFVWLKAGISPDNNWFKYNDNGRDGVGLCDKGEEGLAVEFSSVSTLPNPSLYIRFS